MGFGSWSNPIKKIADTATGIYEDNSQIDLNPATADINIPVITPPDIGTPNINIPDSSHATSMLTTGITKLGENVGYGIQGIVNPVVRNLNELAKLGKEAMTGEGGYSDDEGPGPAAPGPTGFEAATAQRTLLTGQRRKGQGRSAHSGSGSASTV
jgi:hypothetical protein